MKRSIHPRRPSRTLLSAALASCLLMTAPVVFAQSANGTLRGQVTTSSGPAANATVTATNLGTGVVRTVTASASGAYSLVGLPPGQYRIDVNAGGATTSRTVTVQVAQQEVVDFAVGGADATTLAAVEVTGTWLPETKTAEVATYITPQQMAMLPQVNRNFLAYADIVPGVTFNVGGDDSKQLRAGAQGASAVNVFIDGVSQKSYTLPGGISGQDSSRGNPFPQSAIGEYKVITQNYKAEFDQIGSAAIVAATRGGTNEFHGELFYDRFTEDMREKTFNEERFDLPKTEQLDEQYGLSLGGAFIPDRLHYFFAYEGKEIIAPREIIPGLGVPVSALPAELQSQTGQATSPFHEDLYFGRIDFAASDRSFFDFTLKYRDESELTGIGGVNTVSYATDKANEETRAAFRWQFNADAWLNDLQVTWEDMSWGPRAATNGNGYVLTGFEPGQVILATGAGRDFQDKGQEGWGLQDDFSLTNIEWNGYHLIKMGFKLKKVDVFAQEQNPYNPQFYYDFGQSTTVPYQAIVGVPLGGVGDGFAESSNTQFGLYVQDDWEVNDHLTLNLGVRWDYEKSPTYTDYETPADVAAALRGWANIQNTDYDIEDYISDGSQRDAFTTGLQPRLGFSYDFAGDSRTVMFGGIGRSYDRNLFDRLQLELTKATFPTATFFFDTPGHACDTTAANCLPWDPIYFNDGALQALASTSGAGREINLINNDLDMPYTDQASLGIRHTVHDWLLEASISRVESHDGFVFLLGNRRPDGTFFAPGTTWGAPWGFGVPGFGALILGTNGLETRANSLYLKAEKPFTPESPWGVTAAYTFTDAEENRQFGEHYSLDYPDIDDFGWRQAGGVPEHRLVLTGLYQGWYGIMFSGKYQIATAMPRYGLNCHEFGFNDCHPDQIVPDGTGYQQLDLAAYKEWDIGSGVSLKARLDVLNVFNTYNWSGYDTWWGGPSDPNPNLGVRDGSLAGPTRTLKVSVGLIW